MNDKSAFKSMWNTMQEQGYFREHPHYADFFGQALTDRDRELDAILNELDFSRDTVQIPVPYSDALERSVKRTEANWLGRMFELPESGVALDFGCGFGRTVSWLSSRYTRVIGTDISQEAIRIATERCADLPNVQFHVNDSDSLPAVIPEQSVDVGYVFTVFQHIPREYTLTLLTQIRRVLVTRGVVIFNLLSGFNESINQGSTGTEWAIGYSREQTLELLDAAGFELVRLVSWSGPQTRFSWLWVMARSRN